MKIKVKYNECAKYHSNKGDGCGYAGGYGCGAQYGVRNFRIVINGNNLSDHYGMGSNTRHVYAEGCGEG